MDASIEHLGIFAPEGPMADEPTANMN
jgi:hypothetical protein